MKNMGQALYLLHLRQREQLVGALSEWQQLHEFLQCQQQRQRQLQQREQCEWCGLRILQEMGQDSNRQRRSSTLAEGELVPGMAKTILCCSQPDAACMAGECADSPFHGWYCHADRTRTQE